jgi:hypothetical protein
MREQRQDEDRLEYLVKVLHEFMNNTGAGEHTMTYDGVVCDGLCLADDFINETGVDVWQK